MIVSPSIGGANYDANIRTAQARTAPRLFAARPSSVNTPVDQEFAHDGPKLRQPEDHIASSRARLLKTLFLAYLPTGPGKPQSKPRIGPFRLSWTAGSRRQCEETRARADET